jgi:diguanylate cyclase (GGDEF)-like protein
MAIHRSLLIVVSVLLALVVGTCEAVKLTTEHLLYEDATATAEQWARNLAENVRDLAQIAGGEEPSSRSLSYFTWAQRQGFVFRYVIYNREGYSQLVADQDKIALVDISKYSAEAAAAGRDQRPIVAVRSGGTAGLPSFFAEAYVPVIVDGRLVATVVAYVDQTAQRDRITKTFLTAAIALCLLTGLAFGLPAAAWYRRTKEKERADAEIHFLALHDGMTRLFNRAHLKDELAAALIRVTALGGKLAVHYVDLDHFKSINDSLGHNGGDVMIKLTAERIRAVVRSGDIVARLGGDEFVIVQLAIADERDAEGLARRLVEAMLRPFDINGREVVATASVGIALAPRDGVETDRMLKCADLALYKAKADGRRCFRFFTSEMDDELRVRLELETLIRAATTNAGFDLYFQPQVSMPDGRLTGFEALLRLDDHDGNPISPAVFVPVAEDMGLIGTIGAWVLRRACVVAAQWPEHFTIAVNLSPAQFQAGCIYDTLTAALAESGLAPRRLELEITETLLLQDTDAIIAELSRIKSLGVVIVMDDFGTGYSSLSYLWRFPFDKIKIDQSFMHSLKSCDNSVRTIVKTIIGLGHSLNMSVTVEGVERADQVDFVRDVACDQVQGFFFGRPLAVADVPARMLADVQGASTQSAIIGDGKLRIVK